MAHEHELFQKHVNSADDAEHAHHLLGVGLPWRAALMGLSAGFNWQQLLQLFIQYGLPLLIQILQSIIGGKTTVAEVLKKLELDKAKTAAEHADVVAP